MPEPVDDPPVGLVCVGPGDGVPDVGGAVDVGGSDVGGPDEDGGSVVGDDDTGGGTDRVEDPCNRTTAPPGANEIAALHAPAGSIARSTRTVRVIDSPGRSTPPRADSSSQYADVVAVHRTGAPPLAVRVTAVLPGAGRAETSRYADPSPGAPEETDTVGDAGSAPDAEGEGDPPAVGAPARRVGTELPAFS